MLIYLIPIKYACYKVFMVSVLDCTENLEDITHLFVHFSKLSDNYETFLSPKGAAGPRFLRPCTARGQL